MQISFVGIIPESKGCKEIQNSIKQYTKFAQPFNVTLQESKIFLNFRFSSKLEYNSKDCSAYNSNLYDQWLRVTPTRGISNNVTKLSTPSIRYLIFGQLLISLCMRSHLHIKSSNHGGKKIQNCSSNTSLVDFHSLSLTHHHYISWKSFTISSQKVHQCLIIILRLRSVMIFLSWKISTISGCKLHRNPLDKDPNLQQKLE